MEPTASARPGPAATIPASLFDARTFYERDTAIVVDWLAANGATQAGRGMVNKSEMTVKEILSCAERISKRQKTAPQYVHSAFKSALVNRGRMTQWYREHELRSVSEQGATQKHEYFNNTLDLAFRTLFPEQVETETLEVDTEAKIEPEPRPPSNRFDLLEGLSMEERSNLTEDEIQAHLAEWAESNSKEQSRIIDDPFDEIYEFHRFALEMDYLCVVIKKFWRTAATGAMSIPLAGWLTSAGFARVQHLIQVYHDVGGVDLQVFIQQYVQKKAQLQIITGQDLLREEAERSGYKPLSKNFSFGMGLLNPLGTLKSVRTKKQFLDAWLHEQSIQRPTDFIVSAETEEKEDEMFQRMMMLTISDPAPLELPENEASAVLEMTQKRGERDRKAMEVLFRSILQIGLQENKHGHQLFENPLKEELWNYCRGKYIREARPRIDLAFGAQLLLETGKSFIWLSESQPNPVNLRLRTLQFANEIKASIKPIFDKEVASKDSLNLQPQCCYLLDAVLKWLDEFTRTKRFDLYYQMPWTAGAQMCELLFYSMEAGIRVCQSRGVVGAMLHAYNFCRQVAPKTSKAFKILEHLCDLFIDQVFLGSRPTKNFQSLMMLFQGSDLRKDEERSMDKKGKPGRKQRNVKPDLGAPKSPLDFGPGETLDQENERLQLWHLCLFHNLRSVDPPWLGGKDFWIQIFTNKKVRIATTKQFLAIDKQLHDAPFALALERIAEVVLDEFYGDFPVAKINFFKVFDLTVEIFEEIGRRYQQEMPIELIRYQAMGLFQPPPADAASGYSFLFILMQDVERKMEKDDKQIAEEHGGVKLVIGAFEKVLNRKKVEHFFWQQL